LKQFIDIVHNFRAQIPDMTFSTDIIVGYPSETDEDFDKTVNLLNKIQPDVVNLSKYSSRSKTLAHELKQLDAGVVKVRSSTIHRLTRKISLERNKRWLGWTGKIVVDEQVKNAVVGRNFAYKPIVLKEQFDVGDEVSVEIVEVTSHTLVGKFSH
jgi:tRNA A37 methylthiotransferase MiaB